MLHNPSAKRHRNDVLPRELLRVLGYAFLGNFISDSNITTTAYTSLKELKKRQRKTMGGGGGGGKQGKIGEDLNVSLASF